MLLARKKFIVAEVEASYNVDPIPTQAIQTSDVNINPLAGPTVGRNLDRASLGNDLQVLVGTYVELSFKVELSGSGVVGTRPKYGDILLGCGLAETVVALTSVTYSPVSGGFDSLGVYFRHDGQLHKLGGARGSVAFELGAGGIPRLAFTYMGLFSMPESQPDGVPDFSGFIPALPVNNANTDSFSLHGETPVMEAFSVDLANAIDYHNAVGVEEIELYDRAPSGSVTINAPAISSKNWFAAALNIVLGPMSFVHLNTPGSIVTLGAPKTQVTNPAYQGDKTSLLKMGLGFMPDTVDDEISLAFT